MKKSLVGATDGPGELTEFIMTEEEMEWARNTMTPDQLADMLSGGLDLNHFLVMMVIIDPTILFPCPIRSMVSVMRDIHLKM